MWHESIKDLARRGATSALMVHHKFLGLAVYLIEKKAPGLWALMYLRRNSQSRYVEVANDKRFIGAFDLSAFGESADKSIGRFEFFIGGF